MAHNRRRGPAHPDPPADRPPQGDSRTPLPTPPPELIQRYAGRALNRPGAYDGEPDRVVPLSGGERHFRFRVRRREGTDAPESVVVRVAPSVSSDGPRKEARVLARIPPGVGPVLYDFSAHEPGLGGTAVMCLSYVEGATREPETLSGDSCEALGRQLRRLHRLTSRASQDGAGADPRAGTLDLAANLVRRLDADLASKLPRRVGDLDAALVGRAWSALATALGTLAPAISSPAFAGQIQPALLHGDVGHANIVWSSPRSPVLVDWEDARWGDPAEEIAYAITENRLTDAQQAALWAGYRPGQHDRSVAALERRVECWRPLTALGAAIWWLDRHARALAVELGARDPLVDKDAQHYLAQGLTRLEAFERAFGDSTAGAGALAEAPTG